MTEAPARNLRDQVRRYYDNNTSVFEHLGQGGAAIHRAVWGQGVTSRQEAFGYLDKLIAQQVSALCSRELRLLDLGCGLGASLISLAGVFPSATGVGITISPRQAERAQQLIARASLAGRLCCVEGDYLALPDTLGTFDIAFAVESFAHAAEAPGFFSSAARRLRPGGRLIVCDDFVARAARDPRERSWLERIRSGWMLNALVTVDAAAEMGRRSGLELLENRDLTSYLELRRPRDRLLSALLLLRGVLRLDGLLWRSWMGGDALQRALVARLVEYRFTVFERQ